MAPSGKPYLRGLAGLAKKYSKEKCSRARPLFLEIILSGQSVRSCQIWMTSNIKIATSQHRMLARMNTCKWFCIKPARKQAFNQHWPVFGQCHHGLFYSFRTGFMPEFLFKQAHPDSGEHSQAWSLC